MNIVHLSPVYLPYRSGMSNVVLEQARGLARRGHSVKVLTPRYEAGLSSVETENGVGIYRIKPWLSHGNGAFVPGIGKYLKSLPDGEKNIIHLHLPFFGGQEIIWLLKFIGKLPTKLVLQYHHDPQLDLKGKILALPSKLVFKQLLRSADKLIVSSLDYARSSRVKKFIGTKMAEVPLGVDSSRFIPNPEEQVPLFEGYEIFRLLFVGSLDRAHHFKGLDILLQAVAKLKRRRESLPGPKELRRLNLMLSVVGSGEMVEYYDYLANHLKISENVEFIGFVKDEELPEVYQAADALAFPSTGRAEAFGLVALEAMSSGLPVIASKLPGVQTLFADAELLVAPGSVKELAAKLEFLLGNKALSKEIGEKNRQRVLNHYTWDKAIDKLEAVYAKLT